MAWWVVTISDRGRPFIEKQYFNTEGQAQDYANEMGVDSIIVETTSHNRAEAVQKARGKIAKKGKPEFGRNFKHVDRPNIEVET